MMMLILGGCVFVVLSGWCLLNFFDDDGFGVAFIALGSAGFAVSVVAMKGGAA